MGEEDIVEPCDNWDLRDLVDRYDYNEEDDSPNPWENFMSDEINEYLIEPYEYAGIAWLQREAGIHRIISEDFFLADLLKQMRDPNNNIALYRDIRLPKRDGGHRVISVPHPTLLKVQKAINKNVLKEYLPRHPSAFGFSGGSIDDAIKPHLKNRVLYSFDVVDAFGQVGAQHLRKNLERYFSVPVSSILMEIGGPESYDSGLKQGSAMSPRLFDIAFYQTDIRIERLAKKLNGTYTRFADNIFFSLPTNNFPKKIQSAVLRRMSWVDGCRSRINCHKFSVRRLNKGAVRILGLNIVNGEISATRDYKRNLRLAIHHINYLVDNGFSPYYADWLRLQGQMSFAELGSLPNSLLEDYSRLEERIREM